MEVVCFLIPVIGLLAYISLLERAPWRAKIMGRAAVVGLVLWAALAAVLILGSRGGFETWLHQTWLQRLGGQ